MAYWMTSTKIAAKYEVTEQEVLSWAELKEVSSAYINDTLMIDDDSVQFYLETNKMIAEKQAIRARLFKEEDKIIQQELKKYDEAVLFIRLQSQCFPLYALLIKLLSNMIPNRQERLLFCAITQGNSMKCIPKFHHMSEEDKFKVYLEIVQKLEKGIKNIPSLPQSSDKNRNKSLREKNKRIQELEEECTNWKSKCGLMELKLFERNTQKEAWLKLELELRQKIMTLMEKLMLMNDKIHEIQIEFAESARELQESSEEVPTAQADEKSPSDCTRLEGIPEFISKILTRIGRKKHL